MNNCHLSVPPNTDLLQEGLFLGRCILVNGPVIVGAGPSGLAVAAGLRKQGVPFVILERASCIASLWKNRTYDRLNLHLPKQFCELPYISFPVNFPEYLSKHQFINYLESYANHFEINPRFDEWVKCAKYEETCGLWRVKSLVSDGSTIEYMCRWVVVASGENAEKVVPELEGLHDFSGKVMHVCDYKSGEEFKGKRVLVVGCGNSGMEVSLDLCLHHALPSMVVRSPVHVLPREILGKSTFELGVWMMKWMPIWAVDRVIVGAARLILGNIEKYGVKRPSKGPLEVKKREGKTPVLDIGTLARIRTGEIKVVCGVKRFLQGGVELINGDLFGIDSLILATGYSTNVPSWLKDSKFFSKDGFPNGWKGEDGIYAVGFTRRGLSGASMDAVKVAQDIAKFWNQETNQKKSFHWCSLP
ncbi:hypothetical protein ACS0TY_026628 [Phlomoides rotata]